MTFTVQTTISPSFPTVEPTTVPTTTQPSPSLCESKYNSLFAAAVVLSNDFRNATSLIDDDGLNLFAEQKINMATLIEQLGGTSDCVNRVTQFYDISKIEGTFEKCVLEVAIQVLVKMIDISDELKVLKASTSSCDTTVSN